MKCVLFNTRFLLQRNKLLSTNTGAAVARGLVSHGKLGKVVANHFSLNETGEVEQIPRGGERAKSQTVRNIYLELTRRKCIRKQMIPIVLRW